MAQPSSSLYWEEEPAIERNNRVKVIIRCRKCGEKYLLRGSLDSSGQVNTGFKRCLCDNEKDFDIEQAAS
jgi:hypothetical protein